MPITPAHTTHPAIPRRKGEITAERILDAAEALFSEHGFSGTTLRDVALRVGVRIPSLYNHFASKESLYAAVLERGLEPVLGALSEFLEEDSEARGDATRVVERVMTLLGQRPNLPRLVVHETLSGGQRLTPLLRNWIAPIFARAQEMAEAGPAARRWDAERIPLVVLAMYHVVVGYFAMAPLYRQLNGADLMAPAALERQTEFLKELVATLFPEE